MELKNGQCSLRTGCPASNVKLTREGHCSNEIGIIMITSWSCQVVLARNISVGPMDIQVSDKVFESLDDDTVNR